MEFCKCGFIRAGAFAPVASALAQSALPVQPIVQSAQDDEAAHYGEVAGAACKQPDGGFWVNWVATSWTLDGDKGLNDSVTVERSVDGGPWQTVATGEKRESKKQLLTRG